MKVLIAAVTLALFHAACISGTNSTSTEGLRMLTDNTDVVLTGTIATLNVYGPPNYGEDPALDENLLILVLVLDSPVDASFENGTVQYEELHQIQVAGELIPQLQSRLGGVITVRGALFEAVTGHHHTPVLIQVSEIIR